MVLVTFNLKVLDFGTWIKTSDMYDLPEYFSTKLSDQFKSFNSIVIINKGLIFFISGTNLLYQDFHEITKSALILN